MEPRPELRQIRPRPPRGREVESILRGLASRDPADQQEAEKELKTLIERVQRFQKRLWKVQVGVIVLVLLLILLDQIGCLLGWTNGHSTLYAGPASLAVSYVLGRWKARPLRRLLQLDDPRLVGPFIDTLSTNDMQWSYSGDLQAVLQERLERLRPQDADLLGPAQRRKLNGWLHSHAIGPGFLRTPGPALVLAILQTMEQVGDETALPHVERLARSAKDPQVRQAAQECLPALRERVDRERPGHTLLRPVEAGANAAEILLRPAEGCTDAGTGDRPRQQVLRNSLPACVKTVRQDGMDSRHDGRKRTKKECS